MSAPQSKSPGKRVPKENPKFGAQPGMKATQKDRHASVSAAAAMASPQRHGAISPMQQAHDTSIIVRDLLARIVRMEVKAEETGGKWIDVQAQLQQVQGTPSSVQDLLAKMVDVEAKAEVANGKWKDMQAQLQQAQGTSSSVQDLLAKMVDVEAKAEVANGKWKDMQAQLQQAQGTSSSVQDLLAKMVDVKVKAETTDGKLTEMESRVRVLELEVEKLREELGSEREAGRGREAEIRELTGRMVKMEGKTVMSTAGDRDTTTAKGVVDSSEPLVEPEVEPNDPQWEGATGDGEEYVILTDSNGAGVTETTVKRHIPIQKQRGCRIRVYTTYTLFEAFDKIKAGKIKVEGKRVIVDVTTNDVRGTRGLPRIRPGELVDRVGKVVAVLKEKGARGVTICEPKPMTLMDVFPYSDRLRQKCGERKVGWCQTQLGVKDLKEDGFHLLPSSLRVLDKTYAFAVMGVKVPHPTPIYFKWRHELTEQEWPRMRGREELNVWRRREEERRMRT
jgi:spore germination cell wall hydrolase CwlJ-like protein